MTPLNTFLTILLFQLPCPPQHQDRSAQTQEAAKETPGCDVRNSSCQQVFHSRQNSGTQELCTQHHGLDQVWPEQDEQEPQLLLAPQQEPTGVGGRDFSSEEHDLKLK